MRDFLIIGGGIAGVSAAARLAPLGAVTLTEAEDHLAYHASGRSAALFEESYGKPATIALNRASRAWHEAAGVLSPRGLMVVADAAGREAAEADAAAMGLTPLAPEEARALVPILNDRLAWAAHSPAAQDIDTDRLVQGFAREARAHGGEILTGARAERIVRTPRGWAVATPKGEIEARLLVNAAGAWVDEIARMAGIAPLGFVPMRRSMARIAAPGGHDLRAWPMLFGPGESWYAKPDAGALLVSPAEEDPAEPHDAWADDMVLAEGLARYEAMVTEPVTRPIATWAGLRTFAPDRVLVIGFAPQDPAFFWLGGQGGYGMQSSPAASRLAADLIGGRPPELDAATVAALSPARFG
ncbi:MAG: FAD-binding oxidoreductase [Rhodobacteraceae bacterium]|nr:FAD-binding oxidoreductase [Paracoccaceae bacterium]